MNNRQNLSRGSGDYSGLTSPADAVAQAKRMLELKRTVGTASDSLFDTIVVNEVARATALAVQMLGDYRIANDVVHTAFDRARSEFSSYDGSESPRSWVLSYVADEAVNRSTMQADSPRCADDTAQSDTEAALHCLRPERRLAVILTDVLGMTDEAAARIAGVDMRTLCNRVASARQWIDGHVRLSGLPSAAQDGLAG